MSIQDYLDVIKIQWNTDSSGSKISIQIDNEVSKVANGKITLSQIPDYFNKVQINGMYEKQEGVLQPNEFKVNYLNGVINFHESKEAQNITIARYYGRGVLLYPASRIYDVNKSEDVVVTLQNLIDSGETALEGLQELAETIANAEEATLNANISADNADNKATYAEAQGDYALGQGQLANQSATDANSKIIEVENRMSNVENDYNSNLKPNVLQIISDGNLKIDDLNNKIEEYNNDLKPNVLQATESANQSADNADDKANLAQYIADNTKYIEEYNPLTEYKKNNIVYQNGSSFIAKQDSQGNPPPILPLIENEYWALLARRGIDGEGAGDMMKLVYDSNDSGVVDDAERLGGQLPSYYATKQYVDSMETMVEHNNEWHTEEYETVQGATNKANQAEQNAMNYTDNQITLVTETGIPKLNVYEYKFNNVAIGTTEVQIPLETFDKQTDTVKLFINTVPRDTDYFTIVDTVRDVDGNIVTNGKVVLNQSLQKVSKVTIEVWKNIPIGEDGSVSGQVIAIDSMPQNRVIGLETDLNNNAQATSDVNDTLMAHKADIVLVATPNKILRLDSSGKLPASITGDAVTLGGHNKDFYEAEFTFNALTSKLIATDRTKYKGIFEAASITLRLTAPGNGNRATARILTYGHTFQASFITGGVITISIMNNGGSITTQVSKSNTSATIATTVSGTSCDFAIQPDGSVTAPENSAMFEVLGFGSFGATIAKL